MEFNDWEMAKIDRFVTDFPVGTETCVAKIDHGFVDFYGVSHTNAGVQTKNNKDAAFEIGSITKVMTNYLLAQFVVDGKVSLHEPINKYLPVTIKDQTPISFVELATHTSGLPRLPSGMIWDALFKSRDNPYKNCTIQSLLNELSTNVKLKSKGKMRYSNFGSGLLGHVLSVIEGCSYNELLTQHIFAKYKMPHSNADRNQIKTTIVQGMTPSGEYAPYWDLAALAGAGGVLSTAQDLSQFAIASFNQSDQTMSLQKKTAFESHKTCLGLGWMIIDKQTEGERMYFHNGGTGGFSSEMLLDQQTQSGYIILSNVSGLHKLKSGKIDKLVFDLMAGKKPN